MQWTVEELDQLTYVTATVGEESVPEAMVAWWTHIIERAREVDAWDVIVADIWPDTARLIGHVQSSEDAIGIDRGFRVCLRFSAIAEGLHAADFTDEAYSEAQDVLFRHADRSLNLPAVRELVEPFASKKVWFCYAGELVAELDCAAGQ